MLIIFSMMAYFLGSFFQQRSDAVIREQADAATVPPLQESRPDRKTSSEFHADDTGGIWLCSHPDLGL